MYVLGSAPLFVQPALHFLVAVLHALSHTLPHHALIVGVATAPTHVLPTPTAAPSALEQSPLSSQAGFFPQLALQVEAQAVAFPYVPAAHTLQIPGKET
jgi:hypothetical protein